MSFGNNTVMTYFTELNNLPIYPDLQWHLEQIKLDWGERNQVCINTTPENEWDYTTGTGSLVYDWDKSKIITDEHGNERIHVPEREKHLNEYDFTVLCKHFKRTVLEDIYNQLTQKYYVGRVRLMRSKPKTCLSWHKDNSRRIHLPIKTQEGCFMVIENEILHLKKDKWYLTDTIPHHTAFNASREDRIHLVAVVL